LLEVHGVRQVFIVPALIVFFKDFALPAIRPRPTRRAIYERDEGRCSYCGRMLMRNEATIDHVVPKSRGGADGWTNLVLACEPCNTRKGDRTPGEAGMSLHTRPRLPKPRWDSR
jgi:5-methylcytosine-specific restriction endonuclease McrA